MFSYPPWLGELNCYVGNKLIPANNNSPYLCTSKLLQTNRWHVREQPQTSHTLIFQFTVYTQAFSAEIKIHTIILYLFYIIVSLMWRCSQQELIKKRSGLCLLLNYNNCCKKKVVQASVFSMAILKSAWRATNFQCLNEHVLLSIGLIIQVAEIML